MSVLKPDTLVRNPEGCRVVSAVEINAEADRVWAIVGNFAGFDKFIPALQRIDMHGSGVRSVRVKHFADGENVVIEQLNSHDHVNRCMTWSLIYTTLNIGNLWASMQVSSTGPGRSLATWTIQAEPWTGGAEALPDFQAFLQGFADDAMNNVRQMLV
ncbi:MAG: SRPBCC family protein [Pseudomonas sp.]|uniref:SRPBCC family protein n=1 Tax=Pseudomonas abieticivorans TaxID=2931382 RepID=UPI0020BEE95C|nr:SRPBCC family protein [Pseudomonas sp. PIA16]MDE1168689.1 SRPBCC family protein [Pseudomonas sp.]